MSEPSVPSPEVARLCLQPLLALRVVAFGILLFVIVATDLAIDAPLPLAPLAAVILAVAGLTLWGWRAARERVITGRTLLVQLLADVCALAVLVWLTGGASNPFVSLLLLPVTVAAAALSTGATWVVTGAAVAAYTALMLLPDGGHAHPGDTRFTLHLWGMWLGFVVSAGLVACFVARIGATLRARERALADARARALEADRALALGTLAAGTAHELGTPLATIAVLATELAEESADADQRRRLAILREQVERCKQTLARMTANAGQAQADTGRRVALDEFLEEVIAECRRLRPDVQLRVDRHADGPAPPVVADRTLVQAVVNVLANAADASPEHVELHARWNAERLRIDVRDRGPGLAPALRGHAGEPFVTTKAPGRGLGLGLYLARAALARIGGSLELRDAPDRGVFAHIELPLAPLAAIGDA